MGRGEPRHYVVKGGQAYWQPTKAMKAAGFRSVPLGKDSPDAFRQAEEWNRRWDATRTGAAPAPSSSDIDNLSPERSEELTVYPRRSLGAAFRDFRRTDEWAKKAPRTREEWFRAWRYIKPIFGDVDPRTVTLGDISSWRTKVAAKVSNGEAYRAVKIWRALWNVAAASKLCSRDQDPSQAIRNTAPKGRYQRWSEGEVVRLVKQAWRMGYPGLAAAMAVCWDTQLEIGDVRALAGSQLGQMTSGHLVFTERGKTGKPVGALLGRRAARVLIAYIETLGVELVGDAPIFRNRSGRPYSSDTLGDDFRDVRRVLLGPEETRRIGHDFRRSGAGEAIAGGAEPAALAHAMGNTLNTSNKLFKTYLPPNAATIRAATDARRIGRSRLRNEQNEMKSWKASS